MPTARSTTITSTSTYQGESACRRSVIMTIPTLTALSFCFAGCREHLMVKLHDKKIDDKQTVIARKWFIRKHLPETAERERELQAKAAQLKKDMDKICQLSHKHDLIHFFDFNDKIDPTRTIAADSLLAKQGSNPNFLAVSLRAIFSSPNVQDSIKLPLAVRFREKMQVKMLMKKQGIQTGEGGNELTVDARPSECNNDRVGRVCHSLTVDCCCANSDLLCVLGRRAHGQGAAEVRLRCAVPGPPDLLGVPGDAEAGGQEGQRTDLLVGNAAAAGLCVQSNPAPACFDGPSSMALTVPAARRVVTQGPTELKGRSTSTTQV